MTVLFRTHMLKYTRFELFTSYYIPNMIKVLRKIYQKIYSKLERKVGEDNREGI